MVNHLDQDGIFMYIETIMVFSWDSFIVYYHGREGIFMTRSRRYFHDLIERVFSCLDQAGIFMV